MHAEVDVEHVACMPPVEEVLPVGLDPLEASPIQTAGAGREAPLGRARADGSPPEHGFLV